MTLKEALAKLEAGADEKRRKHNLKHGAGDKQFGCKMGDIRKVAKAIKIDRELALQLWETEIVDARLLATLIVKPKSLSADELDRMVRSVNCDLVADWLNSYVVKKHPDNETLRQGWMTADDPMAVRAGWNLTSLMVKKNADTLDLPALLDRLENEMGNAPAVAQWTMNFALVEIGINHPEHRERALAIGDRLGVYSDFPTKKGCTSPFAPIWINAMVARQG